MSSSTLLGFAVLALGIVAARFLKHSFMAGRLGRVWAVALAGVVVLGIVLGIAAAGHSRYPTPDTRLLGFPFLAAVFERSPDGGWTDFVGARTLPATLGNFAVGLCLPQVLFATVVWFSRRRHNVG